MINFAIMIDQIFSELSFLLLAGCVNSSSTNTSAVSSQSVWSFSSLRLGAVSSATTDSSMPVEVQGIELSPPPYNTSTLDTGAIAAWLTSGSWLVPASILSGGGCSTNTSAPAPFLKLHNITMLVEPKSLVLLQQALCAAIAAAAVPPNLDILQVRAGLLTCE
jgi:hypothetical protein